MIMNTKITNETCNSYMIIDIETAECYIGLSSMVNALKHIEENTKDKYTIVTKDNYDDVLDSNNTGRKIMIVPFELTDDEKEAELIIYPNCGKSNLYGEVAEYQNDLINDDLLRSDNPVKIFSANNY